MSGCSFSSLTKAGRCCIWLAALLLAAAHQAGAAGTAPVLPSGAASGLVSYAEGAPFTVIRGDELRTGTRGAGLQAGDILETGADGFLVLQMQSGSLIGIGPGSSVYFTERTGALRLLVREGWVKADFRAQDTRGTLTAARLGIACQHDVVVLHASASRDEIFDEQGDGMLSPRGPTLPHIDPQMHAGQLITSDNRMEVVVTARPSGDFLQGMPKPFRDALPPADAPADKPLATEVLRKVNYGDVEGWLNAQAEWREGFVPRFRGRLKDPAFFAAMDAHLSQHPEWTLILHPPPPPPPKAERRPLAVHPNVASDEAADDDEVSGDDAAEVERPPAGAQPPLPGVPPPASTLRPGTAPQPASNPPPAGSRPSGDPRPQSNPPPNSASDGRRP